MMALGIQRGPNEIHLSLEAVAQGQDPLSPLRQTISRASSL
jgi:hypothetical protein